MAKIGPTPIPERRSSRSMLQGNADGSMLSTLGPGQRAPLLPPHANPRTCVTVPPRAEKALVNLPNPLLASDELHLSKKSSTKTIRVTAGLHRQMWISGYPILIDIHTENRSSKALKRVDLQLEKTILFYNFSAPSTGTRTADLL
ncbi:hypothetical protein OEA41_007363 [Lepraria neglecta]|uniref:Uncharacterized protein n=1 Tax=Lepraria neglecta TaxID=209136 RepID=A0AAD9ZCK5_9LECA|nr:hypothetical protein OEA41_007363 [Lepraria neglecta]